ncbi:alpha/beta hydrolase [Sphaerisporangium corydalis]|uniref:Alpha/beta hydrolase n=1 Tax=Sphaerisporangium corydalis TaxID=1441875 RepID=A0ABV9EBP2_9ACTN|nr:alpha/beta hydrolase [Sphaerisporangium corydalis]
MRRKIPLLALATVVSAALLPLTPVNAATLVNAAPGNTGRTPIAWTACEDDPTAECGTIAVPIDWARPNGPAVDLALARRTATDPAARIGSLVINPGGPGGSGVDSVLFGGRFSQEITRRFDVVGFDPRGVARSHPLVCSAALIAQEPSPFITSRAAFAERLAYNARRRDDCRARSGPLYDHVDTLSVVRDLDAIRAALGDGKLTFYGKSYGTLIGQEYAELFPQRVRALALDSNMDHSLGTRAFLDTEAATTQDSFDEFAAWCDRDASCALHGRDVRAFWAGLLARADRGEISDPRDPEGTLTKLDLLRQAFGAFYGPDWSELAQWLVALDAGTEPPAAFSAEPAPPQTEVVPFPLQVACEDYHLPVRDYQEYAAHLRRSATLAPDMLASPIAIGLAAGCLGQPAPIPNPQHPLRVSGSAPLLLGNAVHDPATAYVWAAGAAAQIGRAATLLTYEGWGHGVYGHGDCTTRAFDAYLVSLTLPARGTRCPAVPPSAETGLQRRPSWPGPSEPSAPGWANPLF